MKQQSRNVKLLINLNEWLRDLKATVTNVVCDYYGAGMNNPSEITIAEELISYYSHRAVCIDSINDGSERFTRLDYGNDIGVNFIQIFENVLESIDDIDSPDERQLAKEVLSLEPSNPKYLKDINQHLNAAVSGMDLFVWTSSWTTLHITDLNQNLDFKNILKKKGLI